VRDVDHPELADARDDNFCYLTTRGRVSGKPHEIEIWFALDGSTLYMLSGGGEKSDWVRNLQADPAVSVRVRDHTYDATARVLEAGTDEDDRARRLVYEKFQPGYSGSLDSWRERSLPVAIDITPQS
jgi:deazaflavin-dependent oxidoreductase (nitroreductase family)